jgi:aminoglycoside phosphotransferase family enzyme
MNTVVSAADAHQCSLADKIAFLSDRRAYANTPQRVETWETHMSFVFAAGDLVYKLKKPIRLPYLDFSSMGRREAACRAEFRLNRALAPQVYLGVEPLTVTTRGLAIGTAGGGVPVDWLVMMRRLDHRLMLSRLLADGHVGVLRLDRLAAQLTAFYRHTARAPMSKREHLAAWRARLAENRGVLFDRRLGLDKAVLQRIDGAQRRFLVQGGDLLAERVGAHRIIDGHGDLRAEHVWLGEPLAVIDRLEFSQRLRLVDPFDELAGLAVECTVLGGTSIGNHVARRVSVGLHDSIPSRLWAFYKSYRATLRARLAIAHLLHPDGRPTEKWPALAQRYLAAAATSAREIALLKARPRVQNIAQGARSRQSSVRSRRALR